MKATGIVRRIDDLGRVVIPKEIRRTMRIREGDPLEIYTDHEGEVIFKKYSPIEELAESATQFVEACHKACGFVTAVIDRDMVVACASTPKKEILERKISSDIDSVIEARQFYSWQSDNKKLPVTTDRQDKYFARVIAPILSEGDIIGAVAVIDVDNLIQEPSDCEIKMAQTAALFFGKQLEH